MLLVEICAVNGGSVIVYGGSVIVYVFGIISGHSFYINKVICINGLFKVSIVNFDTFIYIYRAVL